MNDAESGQGFSTDRTRVLLVEDDDALRSLLEDELSGNGLTIHAVESGEEALDALSENPVDLIVSDLRLPGMSGFDLLRTTREEHDPPSFLVITAFGTISQAVQALKEGADDFLTKPLDLEHLSVRVSRILENRRLRFEVRRYRQALGPGDFHSMIGRSEVMRGLFRDLRRIGRGHGTVLLHGESGVGKELAARAIHNESDRREKPFLAVNCAGIPASLLESEFFGHVKGAFSGATAERPGLFQEASGGTLLLDEISEMPSNLQATLLRVLQEGAVRPVGSDRATEVDVRVIAATNRDLKRELKEDRFRSDLFYRLETFPVRIPALREREGDVELLARHFIQRHIARLGRGGLVCSSAFLARLRSHSFPGNVRELENVLERAVTFCDDGVLEPRHLPPRMREAPMNGSGRIGEVRNAGGGTTNEVEPVQDEPLDKILAEMSTPTLREMEARYVRHVLDHTGGNKRRAAALLGIGRRTLYRKLAEDGAGEGTS